MRYNNRGMAMISDIDLVTQFESLGDNCELGLVQRRVGVDPLGLLRFAGAPLRHLLPALHARFDRIGEPTDIGVVPSNNEYMVELYRYGFNYHADVKIGQGDPVAIHRQQVKTVPFLARKLIDDLQAGEKIFVYRQNEPMLANDLLDLRAALRTYGPVTLLWVQQARPGYPAGSVTLADGQLMIGYVSRLAPRDCVPDLDVASWITMLRHALTLRPSRSAPAGSALLEPVTTQPRRPERIDIAFGTAGNTASHLGAGWSGQENGFCWSIDDLSVVTIPPLQPAEEFCLTMDVVPFVHLPAVPRQRLGVRINGAPVHSIDTLTRGVVTVTLPGALLQGVDPVEIVFEHPDATSPRQANQQKDDRRLAVAFRSLSIAPARITPA